MRLEVQSLTVVLGCSFVCCFLGKFIELPTRFCAREMRNALPFPWLGVQLVYRTKVKNKKAQKSVPSTPSAPKNARKKGGKAEESRDAKEKLRRQEDEEQSIGKGREGRGAKKRGKAAGTGGANAGSGEGRVESTTTPTPHKVLKGRWARSGSTSLWLTGWISLFSPSMREWRYRRGHL